MQSVNLGQSVIGSIMPTTKGGDVSDLGRLTSNINIVLHTYEAISLFNGSKRQTDTDGMNQVEGKKRYTPHNMTMLSSAMMMMEGDIRHDNPFADYWFDSVMQRLVALDEQLDQKLVSITEFMKNKVPEGFSSSLSESENPVAYQVKTGSRAYYKFLYVVLKVDQVVRLIMLAYHICLIDNNARWSHIREIMTSFRSLISAAATYRHHEVDRNDVATNNQRAQQALLAYEKLGIIPTHQHMIGEQRSPFAPDIYSVKVRETGETAEAYTESESRISEISLEEAQQRFTEQEQALA